MPVTTLSAAVHITPVVINTFLKHYVQKIRRARSDKDSEATDDILFDEAFHIVKAFVEFGMNNTVESLQAFTNTHVPSPYWFDVVPVLIPMSTCHAAAQKLAPLLGPSVGGNRWWTVRGLDGVEGEWVAMKADTTHVNPDEIKKPRGRKQQNTRYSDGMDSLKRVILYIHGGGFYWGSINTHRYQIARFARKIKGRAFAVNYRKAPQYPFPCPTQDCLAAYLYLVDPPPDAPHTAIPSKNIVIAGDSAGGNLSLSLLTIIRDLGLPAPAGSVLISPWVDLTHSFPSVMNNTGSDIIPPHGFIHRRSALWPLTTTSDQAPYISIINEESPSQSSTSITQKNTHINPNPPNSIPNVSSEDAQRAMESPDLETPYDAMRVVLSPEAVQQISAEGVEGLPDAPRGPTTVELRSQIQLYATNGQLTHPLVSPLLQGSLGGLPPLYILAGDGELLRDEVMYLAHRAANPQEYPLRSTLEQSKGEKVKELNEKPTKVHLQVFDGMCHVLTVFTFIDPAHYAYNAISDFVKRVIDDPEEDASKNPFPDSLAGIPSDVREDVEFVPHNLGSDSPNVPSRSGTTDTSDTITSSQTSVPTLGPDRPAMEYESTSNVEQDFTSQSITPAASDPLPNHSHKLLKRRKKINITRAPFVNSMIRERVSITGVPRPMEPPSAIPILQIPVDEVGVIKEAPVVRWLTGLQESEKKDRRSAGKITKEREKNTATYEKIVDHARTSGISISEDGWMMDVPEEEDGVVEEGPDGHGSGESDGYEANMRGGEGLDEDEMSGQRGHWVENRRWGPLDLKNERAAPSAICKRKNTVDSITLLRTSLRYSRRLTTAGPSITMPEAKKETKEAIRDIFGTSDEPPKQSAAEQQVRQNKFPAHGVGMWSGMMNHYYNRSKKKVKSGAKAAKRTSSDLIG